MYNSITGFPNGLQPIVWRASVRAEGLAASKTAIPTPSAMFGFYESVADNVAASWLF